ncbi:MAG TPA: response regulator transcription factor [Acidobacteriota bacterium]|nr:response regulator transcription factor [Acidobacteriota bacterium]
MAVTSVDVWTDILVVEDTVPMARAICRRLGQEGFSTARALDGREALALLAEKRPRLMILDWRLPEVDGLEVLRRVRGRDPQLPILMLSALGEEADRVVGLEMGADDYLPKPFGMRELVARVKALLRRGERSPDHHVAHSRRALAYGPLVLDRQSRRCEVAGEDIPLTPTEFDLLDLLLRHPGRAFSRDFLLDTVWGQEVFVTDRAVDNAVLRLRKKLGGMGPAVETVWGIGYRLSESPPWEGS